MEKSLAGYFLKLQSRFFLGEGGGRREDIPCNSLLDAVNLPCATSHSNASKLDAMFVDQCCIQFVGVRGKRKRKREERKKERERVKSER